LDGIIVGYRNNGGNDWDIDSFYMDVDGKTVGADMYCDILCYGGIDICWIDIIKRVKYGNKWD
jgi:hypothetical protein